MKNSRDAFSTYYVFAYPGMYAENTVPGAVSSILNIRLQASAVPLSSGDDNLLARIKELCQNTSKLAAQNELQLNINTAQLIIDKAIVNQSITDQLNDFVRHTSTKLPNLTVYEKLVLYNEFIDILELEKFPDESRVLRLEEYTGGSYIEMRKTSVAELKKLYVQLQDDIRPNYSELNETARQLPDLQRFLDDPGTDFIIWKFRILLTVLQR